MKTGEKKTSKNWGLLEEAQVKKEFNVMTIIWNILLKLIAYSKEKSYAYLLYWNLAAFLIKITNKESSFDQFKSVIKLNSKLIQKRILK